MRFWHGIFGMLVGWDFGFGLWVVVRNGELVYGKYILDFVVIREIFMTK